jgi:transcriptional regulator with XRE-family HTH domain
MLRERQKGTLHRSRLSMKNARTTMVKILLLQRGCTQADIARGLPCSRAFVSQVISGARRSARVEGRIAQHLGMPKEALWPK